jgi:hypothetical protein
MTTPQVAGAESVILKAGKQTLEFHPNGLVVCNGFQTDWVTFYDHKQEWRCDGVFAINKPIVKMIDRMSRDHFFKRR